MATTTLDAIRATAESGAVRSKLGRWFAANHAAFADTLLTYRPRWEGLVETFATEGLLSLPPEWHSDDPAVQKKTRRKTVEAARKTWLRVDAAKRTHPAVAAAATRPPATVRAAATADDTDDDHPPIIRRNVTRPK